MTKQIVLDLSQAATRASLLSQLEAAMDELAYAEYSALMDQALAISETVSDKDSAARNASQQLSLTSVREDYRAHTLQDVHDVIDGWGIPDDVCNVLYQVYDVLAQAEASVHESVPDQVHFHEVGKMSALQNTLRICAAFHVLSAEILATPIQTGKGTVLCAHGEMDIPTPATKAILQACNMPVQTERLEGELCTPTSAAILAVFVNSWISNEDVASRIASVSAEASAPKEESKR